MDDLEAVGKKLHEIARAGVRDQTIPELYRAGSALTEALAAMAAILRQIRAQVATVPIEGLFDDDDAPIDDRLASAASAVGHASHAVSAAMAHVNVYHAEIGHIGRRETGQ